MIARSPGIPIGVGGYLAGGGYRGATEELDAVVAAAAEALRDAYGREVAIRFNSDRRSGGAWLRTDEPDGVWLNAEVGICASLITEERERQLAERYPEHEPREPGVYLAAHVGKRVGEYAHEPVETIAEALAYVQARADLSRLTAPAGGSS